MSTTTSFLPEDYLDQKAERRTNMISLSLFGIVMVSVFAAFLVTNRQWSQVKSARASINEQYEQAATQIETLNELEQQKNQMLSKARLAAALVERVPRSILLAELINRMPNRLGLLEFELKSQKIKPAREAPARRASTGRLGPKRAMTRAEAANLQDEKKVEPPRYQVSLTLVGVAPTDVEVSQYISELNSYPLLRDVNLEYSEERKFEGDKMRQFEIKMTLNPNADVRDAAPTMKRNSVGDPMSDELKITPGAGSTAAVPPRGEGGG
ncbi:MAG: PilN domain-containing protein [Planctomycetota bacterium]|jgi:Tfp pilus assembly protein PilN